MSASRTALWALVVVLVALHFFLRVGLGLGLLVPDLLVVALLLAARELRTGPAAALGLVLGILDGGLTPLVFGASALALSLLGLIASRMREFFAGYSAILLAIYLFAGKLLFDVLLYMVTSIVAEPGAVPALLSISIISAVYAAAAGLLAHNTYRSLT